MARKNEDAGLNATGVVYGVSFGEDAATVWTVPLGEAFDSETFDGETITFHAKLIHAVNAISDAVVQGVDAKYRKFVAKGWVLPAIKRAVKAGEGEAVTVPLALAEYNKEADTETVEVLETAAAE